MTKENLNIAPSKVQISSPKRLIKLCAISTIILQSCAPMNYKVPSSKADYDYYGSQYKNSIEAIKYCNANEEVFSNSPYNDEKNRLSLEYEKLRNTVKEDQYPDKEYPIASKKPVGEQAMYYGVYLPLIVITSPIWIWPYLEEYENKPRKSKTIKGNLEYCDNIYRVNLINKRIEEANFSLRTCKDDMSSYEDDKTDYKGVFYSEPYYSGLETFRNIKNNSDLGYLLENYKSDKEKYSKINSFDLDQANSCVSFYQKLILEKGIKAKKAAKQNKINKANNIALASKFGYKDLYEGGLLNIDGEILMNKISVNEAKKFLIKKGEAGYGDFDLTLIVESVVNDVVIYSSSMNHKLKIALKKEAGEFYGQGSYLSGKYFAVAGTTTLKTNRGSMEMVVYKKIK